MVHEQALKNVKSIFLTISLLYLMLMCTKINIPIPHLWKAENSLRRQNMA